MILLNAGKNYPELTIRTSLPPWGKKKGGKNKRISDYGFLISELILLSDKVFQYHVLKPPHLCGSREGAGGEYMNNFGFRIFDFGISLLVRFGVPISCTEAAPSLRQQRGGRG